MEKFLLLLFVFSTIAIAQIPKWINYTNGQNTSSIAIEGDIIWAGTNGGLELTLTE